MTKNPLFSTYRQGENRVTSSMLAVFERIDLSLLEALLAAASAEASLQLVSFVNQPAGRGASIPDARISARFAYWFEVKTARNALDVRQLTEHLKNLDETATDERLFVVTPDAAQPPAVAALGDPRVVWFSFLALSDAIEAAVADPRGLVSEQARFLLRELQALLVEDGLLDNDDVVVVAARIAYQEYLDHGVYVCQPNRAFREGLTHLGFYANGAIQPHIARILYRGDVVPFTCEEIARRRAGGPLDQRVANAIDALVATSARQEGNEYGVFVLSTPDDPDTVGLEAPIVNDTVAESGRPWAWTMSQRYISLARLNRPGVTVTSDLEVRARTRPPLLGPRERCCRRRCCRRRERAKPSPMPSFDHSSWWPRSSASRWPTNSTHQNLEAVLLSPRTVTPSCDPAAVKAGTTSRIPRRARIVAACAIGQAVFGVLALPQATSHSPASAVVSGLEQAERRPGVDGLLTPASLAVVSQPSRRRSCCSARRAPGGSAAYVLRRSRRSAPTSA